MDSKGNTRSLDYSSYNQELPPLVALELKAWMGLGHTL